MRNIAVLDVETTGIDPNVDVAIEVAVALFDVEHACVVRSMSTLIECDRNPAFRINEIPVTLLAGGYHRASVWEEVNDFFIYPADAVVAYQAEFDRAFVPKALQTLRPWICARQDLVWELQKKPGGSLTSLALDYGLGVASAHRAMADVDTLCRILRRVSEMSPNEDDSLTNRLKRASAPKGIFQALVSYEERDLAKAAGFNWNGTTRTWTRRLPLDFEKTLGGFTFRTRLLEELP